MLSVAVWEYEQPVQQGLLLLRLPVFISGHIVRQSVDEEVLPSECFVVHHLEGTLLVHVVAKKV